MADLASAVVIASITVALYLRLPRQGDIWWMDASRHALNGAFVLDFLRAMPLRNPMGFAIDYYRHLPGLTIGFYPPLFYLFLAASYSLFGVSEASALVPELAFLVMLSWGSYCLSRQWLNAAPSLAVALMIMGAPEVSYWGQQVMLDVPAYAFLVWGMHYLTRYIKGGAQNTLYAAVICAVLSVYTKYNAAFIFAVMAVTLLYARGWKFALSWPAVRAAALGIFLMAPLLIMFHKFSAYNLDQAASVEGSGARWSFDQLTYYAAIMGSVISWPTLALAVIYVALLPFVRALRIPKTDSVMLLVWLIIGYLFYSMIAVKEPRHILFITYPIALAAVLLLEKLLGGFTWRSIVPLTVASAVFLTSLPVRPAPFVTGMRQAAQLVAHTAPPNSNVAFWGRLDGTFIFAMRAYTDRTDVGVVRLDKLLLSGVAVAFGRGFKEKDLTSQLIVDNLHDLHVQYVVIQSHYGDDIGIIKKLNVALKSNSFREVARIPMTSNYRFSYITDLVIYRAVKSVPPGRISPSIEVKLINRTL